MTDKTLRLRIFTDSELGSKGLDDLRKQLDSNETSVKKLKSAFGDFVYTVQDEKGNPVGKVFTGWAHDITLVGKELEDLEKSFARLISLAAKAGNIPTQLFPAKTDRIRSDVTGQVDPNIQFALDRKAAAEQLAHDNTIRAAKEAQKVQEQLEKESFDQRIQHLREYDNNIEFWLDRKAAAEKLEYENSIQAAKDLTAAKLQQAKVQDQHEQADDDARRKRKLADSKAYYFELDAQLKQNLKVRQASFDRDLAESEQKLKSNTQYQLTILREGANSAKALKAKEAQDIEAIYKKLYAELDKLEKKFVAEQGGMNWSQKQKEQNALFAKAQADILKVSQPGITASNNKKDADSLVPLFKQGNKLITQEIEERKVIAQKGADSIAAIELQAKNRIATYRTELSQHLEDIRRQVESGILPISDVQAKAAPIFNDFQSKVNAQNNIVQAARDKQAEEKARKKQEEEDLKAFNEARKQIDKEYAEQVKRANQAIAREQAVSRKERIAFEKQEQADRATQIKEYTNKILQAHKLQIRQIALDSKVASDDYKQLKAQEAIDIKAIELELQKDLKRIQKAYKAGKVSEQGFLNATNKVVDKAQGQIQGVIGRTSTFEAQQQEINKILAAQKDADSKYLARLKERVAIQESITRNGMDDLKTIQLLAAHEESKIYDALARKKEEINSRIKENDIKSIKEARIAAVRAEQQAATEIMDIRQTVYDKLDSLAAEKEAQKTKNQQALADKKTQDDIAKAASDRLDSIKKSNREEALNYKSFYQEQLSDLDNFLKLDAATRLYGANHVKTLSLKAAQEETRIKKNLAYVLQGIEEQIRDGVISRVQAEVQTTALLESSTKRLQELALQEEALNKRKIRSFGDLAKKVAEVYVLYNGLNLIGSTLSQSVRSIIPVGIALDAVRASLESTVGSSAGAASAIKAIREEANRTGLELGALRTDFKLFQASTSLAGTSLNNTWKMFQNINTVQTALHATTAETNHVFLAFSQIMNKSRVQSEELVKQLGNLWPGAFASFAASYKKANGQIGISTEELSRLMKQGLVSANKTLLDFTDFMANRFAPSFAIATTLLNADIGRMKTEFTTLGETIYSISSGPLQEIVQSITRLTAATSEWIKEGKSFNTTLYAIKAAIIGLAAGGTIAGLLRVGEILKATAKTTSLLEASFAFLARPFVIVAGIAAITTAIYDYTTAAEGAVTSTTNFLNELEKKRQFSGTTYKPLDIRVSEDPALNQIDRLVEQLKEAEAKAKGLGSIGGIALQVYKFNDDNYEALKKNFNELKEFNKELKELPIENKAMGGEAAAAYIEAYINLLLKRKGEISKTVREELTKQEDKDRENYIKALDEPDAKKVMRESENIKAQIEDMELIRQKAIDTYGATSKAARGYAHAIEDLTTKLDIQQKKEVNNEDLTSIDNALLTIRGRLKVNPETGQDEEVALAEHGPQGQKEARERDLEQLKEYEGRKAAYEARFRSLEAKSEADHLQRMRTLNNEEYRNIESERKEQVKTSILSIEEEMKQIEGDYKQGTRSMQNFYAERARLLQQQQITKISNIDSLIGDADRLNQKEERKRLVEEKKQAVKEYEKGIDDTANKLMQDVEKYERAADTFEELKTKFSGEPGKAAQLKFDNKNAEFLKALKSQLWDEDIVGETRKKLELDEENYAIARANIAAETTIRNIEHQRNRENTEYSQTIQRLNILQQTGAISTLEYKKLQGREDAKHIAYLEEVIRKEQEAIDLAKNESPGDLINPELQTNLDVHKAALEELKLTASSVSRHIADSIGQAFETSFQQLTDFSNYKQVTNDVYNNKIARLKENISLQRELVNAQEASFVERAGSEGYNKARLEADKAKNQAEIDHLKAMGGELQKLQKQSYEAANDFSFSLEVAKQAFASFANAVVAEMQKMIAEEIRSAFIRPFISAAISGVSSLFGGIGAGAASTDTSLMSSVNVSGLVAPKALGGAYSGGMEQTIHRFGKGGDFTNKIVSSPTLFRFAKGTKLGEMGEAGEEAIMPLARDSSGSLGVKLVGGQASQQVSQDTYNITMAITVDKGADPSAIGNAAAQAFITKIAAQAAKNEIHKAARPGNKLNAINTF